MIYSGIFIKKVHIDIFRNMFSKGDTQIRPTKEILWRRFFFNVPKPFSSKLLNFGMPHKLLMLYEALCSKFLTYQRRTILKVVGKNNLIFNVFFWHSTIWYLKYFYLKILLVRINGLTIFEKIVNFWPWCMSLNCWGAR